MNTARILLEFFVITILTVGSLSASSLTEKCHAVRWPFSRTQSQKDMFAQMKSLDRHTLIEYYFGELTNVDKKNVANEISIYLAQTEFDKDRRDFIKFLAAGANLNREGPQKELKIKEVCDLFNKIEASKAASVSKN